MDTSVKLISDFLAFASKNNLSPCSISLYVAIVTTGWEQNDLNTIQVNRRKLMAMSSIKSIATYHKCINNFVFLGKIEYTPSYHPKKGSKIILLAI